MIRALLVDDEPPAREGLRLRLADQPDFEVVAEAGNGAEALRSVRADQPDVVFLDVQMPDMTGFEVLDALAVDDWPPAIVFVTAHDEHALRAFDVHALDYLLKPITDQRFERALGRVRHELAVSDAARRHDAILRLLDRRETPTEPGGPRRAWLRRLSVRKRGRHELIDIASVVWFQSARNYVRVHTEGGSHLVRMTMRELEARLDPRQFGRTHRSAIVSFDAVRSVRTPAEGAWAVELHGGPQVRLSRAFAEPFLEHR